MTLVCSISRDQTINHLNANVVDGVQSDSKKKRKQVVLLLLTFWRVLYITASINKNLNYFIMSSLCCFMQRLPVALTNDLRICSNKFFNTFNMVEYGGPMQSPSSILITFVQFCSMFNKKFQSFKVTCSGCYVKSILSLAVWRDELCQLIIMTTKPLNLTIITDPARSDETTTKEVVPTS